MAAEEIERLAWDGVKKFDGKTAIYIKQAMYWAEHGTPYSVVAADPESTRFALCLFEAPMHTAKPSSLTVSPFRRPSPRSGDDRGQDRQPLSEFRPHDLGGARARLRQCAGAGPERQCRRDRLLEHLHGQGRRGHDADPQRHLPRRHHPRRIIGLLRQAGFEVLEITLTVKDFMDADEIFQTGNYSKVVPVTKLDAANCRKAR